MLQKQFEKMKKDKAKALDQVREIAIAVVSKAEKEI